MFPSRLVSVLGGGAGLQNNYSLEFDGTNDYVDCGNDASVQVTGALTLSAWIKTSNTGAVKIIVSKDNDSERNFHLAINASNFLSGGLFNSGTGYFATGDVNICDGAWHHVAFIFIPSTSVNVYVDAVLDATNTTSTPAAIDNDTVNLLIGRLGEGSYDFSGNIDEVAIWNTALSAGDISALYQSKGTSDLNDDGNSANLQGWWRMGDGVLDDFNLIADQVNPTLGSELVTNGDMELDANWANYAGDGDNPTANVRSTTQEHGGTYSRGVTTTDDYAGIYQTITTISGSVYRASAWIYGDATNKIAFQARGSSLNHFFGASGVVAGDVYSASWTKVEGYFISDTTGVDIRFYAGDGEDDTFTWYIDDVSVKKVNGNPGLMTNMASDDIVKDTP